jgi:putative ABC transport system permease protein
MWTHDVRQALRIFRREPAFATAAILTLTLGIGANTALFALVDAALLRPLPFDRADELVVLRYRDTTAGLTKPDINLGDFVDLRQRQRSLESLAAYGAYQSTLYGQGEPRFIEGAVVTPDALDALGVRPVLGRTLREEDARQGAPPVALISAELWRTVFGSDPDVVSRSVQLGATRAMVVGVMPPGFRFPTLQRADVIVPEALPNEPPTPRKSGWLYGMGRLRPGVTLQGAAADLATISQQMEREHPEENRGSMYEVRSLRDTLVGDTRRPLLLLLAAAGFVLLIACANVGNLLLARALGRQQELAVRVALGASRRRLILDVLTEGLALAIAGGLAGVAVASFAAPVLAALIPNPGFMPALEHPSIDVAVLLFAVGAAVVSSMTFSAVACVSLLRGGDHAAALGQRRGTMTPGARRAASSLVAGEIALAVVLLAGAGLTLLSFNKLLSVDPGFNPAGVLTVEFALPDGRYQADEARRAFYQRAFADIAAVPSVRAVGAAQVTPLTGNTWAGPLQRVDRPRAAGERGPEVGWQMASRGYFAALQIPLRSGRLFDPHDASGPAVVIISQATADRYFPGESPLGHRIDMGDEKPEIVGVVGNIRRTSLVSEPWADMYVPFEKVAIPSVTMFIRTTGDPVAVLPAVRAAVRRIEPDAIFHGARTLSDIAEESAAATRLASRLLAGFASIALLLAATGVYGVMSYSVRRRSRELGTRLALGASPADITRLVLRQAGVLAGVGLTVGTAAALVLARTLTALLFGVPPWDPLTLASAAGLLAAATLAASYLPARRAARVDPVAILASE